MTRRGFVAALTAAPYLQAQTRAEKGKSAIDQVVGAIGGQSFLEMRTRVETGRAVTLYRDQLTGFSQAKIYTEYLRAPEPGKLGVHERQAFGKKEDSAVLFLDGRGYEVTYRGARPLPDEQLERYYLAMRHNIFYVLRQRLKEPGLIFELTGQEVLENQSVDVIDIYDAENENIKVWVNSFTHLPIRQRWYRREENTGYRYEEVTHFTKYRAANNGVMWPMDLQRERDGERVAEIYNEHVNIDVSLKEELFVLPPGLKMLPKEKT